MLIGCIADDFTGASDIASFFNKGGLSVVLFNGIPSENKVENADVYVIALKTRTLNTSQAVQDSLQAIRWLKNQGAKQYYVKYCSTFDSTPKGNIGPICDAVLEYLNVQYSILVPSLPVNGRTVENGHLFVNGVPLDESSMRDHPLTPMWDSEISNLMKEQSKYPCHVITQPIQQEIINSYKSSNNSSRYYLIPDYSTDLHGENIIKYFGDLKVITGGSGLAEHLGRRYLTDSLTTELAKNNSKTIFLAGSCSERTREQIAYFKEQGYQSYFIDVLNLKDAKESAKTIWSEIKNKNEDILIYSSDTSENIQRNSNSHLISELIEETLAELSKIAIEDGFTNIIVAGGETSGAIVKKLGLEAYKIGRSVTPGIPILQPLANTDIRLVLKSGNFGEKDFFIKARAYI
ncbi:3-oxo-tetronate kinase [Chryseomicrobium palamuruense]|uniref:3-oxo-tetronate kinase n=1 Tax=Chryseomicrobium palamuruense TaxID=682973 RepID=A0ABV8UU49_9BACL